MYDSVMSLTVGASLSLFPAELISDTDVLPLCGDSSLLWPVVYIIPHLSFIIHASETTCTQICVTVIGYLGTCRWSAVWCQKRCCCGVGDCLHLLSHIQRADTPPRLPERQTDRPSALHHLTLNTRIYHSWMDGSVFSSSHTNRELLVTDVAVVQWLLKALVEITLALMENWVVIS